jgi:hypothetical protein
MTALLITISPSFATPSFADVEKAVSTHNCSYARNMMESIHERRPESVRAEQLGKEVEAVCPAVLPTPTLPPTEPSGELVWPFLGSGVVFALGLVALRRKLVKDKQARQKMADEDNKGNYSEPLTIHGKYV